MMIKEQSIYYVYIHRKASNGEPFYVGVGKGQRCKNFSNRSSWWKSIKEKHGVTVEILKDKLSFSESRDIEMKVISTLIESGASLCNITDGGEGRRGFKLSNDVKKKISDSNKGKNKGRKHSEETKAKMSLARKGYKHTPETIKRISESQKGIPKPKSTYWKGKSMPNHVIELMRRPKSMEHRAKLSEAAKKRFKREAPPNADMSTYTFKNQSSGDTFTGTRRDFQHKFGISVKPLFGAHKKVQKSVKGWSIDRE